MFDDNASAIHFTTGRRHVRHGSGNSLASMADSIRRVNTASSFFKRLLSRDDSRPGTAQTDGGGGTSSTAHLTGSGNVHTNKMPKSASNTSLAGSKVLHPGSMRITDQVIEEVDEQMTITSMRGQPEVRPTAQDLFSQGPITNHGGPPPASKPVDVPLKTFNHSAGPAYGRTHSVVSGRGSYEGNDDFISCSAPPAANFRPPTPPGFTEFDQQKTKSKESGMSGTMTAPTTPLDELAGCAGLLEGVGHDEGDNDDFDKLRLARERERQERQKLVIARSISTTQATQASGQHQTATSHVDLVAALNASVADDLNARPSQ